MSISNLITPQHLTLMAVIYIRQSSPQQVLSNQESLRLQYTLQQHLHLRSVKHLRERYLQPLVAAGLLAMTEPAHPNAPAQKYVTTEAGHRALSAE